MEERREPTQVIKHRTTTLSALFLRNVLKNESYTWVDLQKYTQCVAVARKLHMNAAINAHRTLYNENGQTSSKKILKTTGVSFLCTEKVIWPYSSITSGNFHGVSSMLESHY